MLSCVIFLILSFGFIYCGISSSFLSTYLPYQKVYKELSSLLFPLQLSYSLFYPAQLYLFVQKIFSFENMLFQLLLPIPILFQLLPILFYSTPHLSLILIEIFSYHLSYLLGHLFLRVCINQFINIIFIVNKSQLHKHSRSVKTS